jgi:regulator of sirC expression with transglutaminase-like and TPR domain
MRRRAFLLAAASCGCSAPARRWDFARAALRAGQRAGASETERAFDQLNDIAERAQAAYRTRGISAASALGTVLFDELGFVREIASSELGFVLLPGVLSQRRGNCVGLGTLYLALAEALGFAAHGVLRPGHFYVHHRAPGEARNVELLRRGEALPDSWYRARYPLPPNVADAAYARPLSASEVLGVIEYDVGNERRRQQRPLEARAAYARAVELCPHFPEAHASLGAMQHLLGDGAAALRSYRVARGLNPSLAGLDQNMALLQAEPLFYDLPEGAP